MIKVWAFIIENEGSTIMNAATRLGLNRGTLSKDLDTLERLGFIKREIVRGPPKRVELKLTEKGRKLADHVLAIYRELES